MAGQDAPGHRLYGCSPSSYRLSEGQPKLLSIAPGEPSPARNERLHESFLGQVSGAATLSALHTVHCSSPSPVFSHTASIVGSFVRW